MVQELHLDLRQPLVNQKAKVIKHPLPPLSGSGRDMEASAIEAGGNYNSSTKAAMVFFAMAPPAKAAGG
jgi:hypothetical protein